MNIKILKTNQEFVETAKNFILEILKKNPHANIALSGGKTPSEIYTALGKKFPQGNFFQVDERYVPKTDENSNQKMIHETLNPLNFHYFNTTLPIEESLKQYAEELPNQFDLIILGIGEDGHFASIFPNTPKTEKKAAHTTTDHFPIKDRLTLTLGPILNSKTILILLKNRPEVLHEMQNPTKSKEDFPALNLLEHPNLHIYSSKSPLTRAPVPSTISRST